MWELCEIELLDLENKVKSFFKEMTPFRHFGYKGQFVAKAVGPKGTRIVGTSREFMSKAYTYRTKEAEELVRELVAELLNDGWEPTEQNGWFNYKFRRIVE